MPIVDWKVFEQLPGSTESNFEKLCRNLIRWQYGQYGIFAARANQPGVEFHLNLHSQCSLGNPGRWYGWQCRWYGLQSGTPIGQARREKILKAIKTTEKELSDVTDWVLWTRHPLTANDQKWYYKIKTHMRLVLWTGAEVEEHLSDNAIIFRGTYFGELILTPDGLANMHKKAVAPIRQRWRPEVHQTVDAERKMRRMLVSPQDWTILINYADNLRAEALHLEQDLNDLDGSLTESAVVVVNLTRKAAAWLIEVHESIIIGRLDLLCHQLANSPDPIGPEQAVLPRHLRASRKHAALTATNLIADLNRVGKIHLDVKSSLNTGMIAVLAEAGCGKTQLAAQLTAASGERPAGIFLYGRDLHAGNSLDDLARDVVIQGSPIPSMEALVAALDAAGQRAHRRLPMVIDGLNEAEDPRDWRKLLSSLNEILGQYPYVLVVCTLRPAFANEALPSDIKRLEIPNFGSDTIEAIKRYFSDYRINPADAELPIWLLSHPLTLRLFCEVANPKREREVGIEAMPLSLTDLFERYLKQAGERIAELAPRTQRYYEQDVYGALDRFGLALWEEKNRSIAMTTIRYFLNDENRPWNASIVRALEQEGVLLRVPGETPGEQRVEVVFDKLAGYLIANAILTKHGYFGFEEWLKEPTSMATLSETHPERHPLGADTLKAFVGLIPRRHRRQLWPLLDEPLRVIALCETAYLAGSDIDTQTVNALSTFISEMSPSSYKLLDRLMQTRGIPNHPLNAEFLDAILRPMTVADRDLRWSEWIRSNVKRLKDDLEWLENRWRNKAKRNPDEILRARWAMWTLTSTVCELRDQATRTLYWFGRGDPSALFDLALDALAINDAYVGERMLAASYGAAMAHQIHNQHFAVSLGTLLTGLCDALIGSNATHPTSHWLIRLHVKGLLAFAHTYYPEAIAAGLEENGPIPFAPGSAVEPIAINDPRAKEIVQTLHTDFINYTLGRLFDDRHNYDMNHKGHQDAVAHVRGMVWKLGWRAGGLGVRDKSIIENIYHTNQAPIERYGKKYGWIGFFTFAGMLDDSNLFPEQRQRLSDIHIDPSFPEAPPPVPINIPIWAGPTPVEDQQWICEANISVPDDLLYHTKIQSSIGSWIAVYGHLHTHKQAPGREVFGFIRALLIAPSDANRLRKALKEKKHPGNYWIPEAPSDYYTFAGEIPWHPEFARKDLDSECDQLYRYAINVDNGTSIEVEILAHQYAWESYHSIINQEGGALLPSIAFSKAFNLYGKPQSFDQVEP